MSGSASFLTAGRSRRTVRLALDRGVGALLVALGGLVVTLSLVPLSPGFHGTDLESAWVTALHYSAVRRFIWGRDIIFTFGPLGFVLPQAFWPGTYSLVVGSWAFLSGLVIGSVVSLARTTGRCHAGAAAFMAAFAMIIAPPAIHDATILGIIMLVTARLLASGASRGWGYPALAGAALGMLALTKGSYLIVAPILLVLYGLKQAWLRRLDRAALATSSFLVVALSLWLATGAAVQDLWPFVRGSLALAGGYGDAMSIDGPALEILIYVMTSAALLVGLAAWARGAHRSAAVDVAAFGFLLFVAFKQGFIRHDQHAIIAARVLLAAVTLVAFAYRGSGWLVRGAYGVAAAGAVTGLMVTAGTHSGGLQNSAHQQLNLLFARGAAAMNLSRVAGEHEAIHARIAGEIAQGAGIRDVRGPADVISYRQQILLDSGIAWQPRPVFQSYAAYTPALLRLNADAYVSPTAPREVLFDVETIDNRFPSLDDALLWPILLTRYDMVGARGAHLLLRRAPQPREFRLRPVATMEARLGREIVVPETASGLVWASIDVRTTLLGRLAAIAYKVPPVHLDVTTASRRAASYRLIRGAAEAGFLLSPVIRDAWEFSALASGGGELGMARVRTIRVPSGTGSRWPYEKRAIFRFWELSFSPQVVDHRTLWVRALFEGAAEDGTQWSVAGPGTFRPVEGPRQAIVMLAHAPSGITFTPARPVRRLEIAFGILDRAWKSGGTDGVEFRVSAGGLEPEAVLWSRLVRPGPNPEDRGILVATVDVPEPWRRHSLVLETLPGPSADTRWDWSFWSKVRVIE